MSLSEIFHPLTLRKGETLPEQMNDPFDYEPHPLCRRAAEEVCAGLSEHPEWSEEIADGKMFGVLLVCDKQGRVGYLSAFSGNLAGTNHHIGFVPPVYDMLHPDDHFRREEAAISEINRQIDTLEERVALSGLREYLVELKTRAREEIDEAKQTLKVQKATRDAMRVNITDAARLDILSRESQFLKAEFVRLKKRWRAEIEQYGAKLEEYQLEIETLCSERKRRSEQLQMWLFEQFEMLNAQGAKRNLCEIFAPTSQRVPPAGAGECAAPKLLQYAYRNRLQPLAMAEFWQGRSPRGEMRHHGAFYTSCKDKCAPILGFMLQGLDVQKRTMSRDVEPILIYEDESLAVVVKPEGMLSVEGRSERWSVEQWAKERFTEASRVMVVHRLDMATSGLLLVAKSLDVYRTLQRQFHARTVGKRYIALLDGAVALDRGRIELPLAADYANRPCQKVDFEGGKSAVTEFRVVERRGVRTLVEFTPLTGRTHQLRLHAAHAEGLNAPIVGDVLYGHRDKRLCLHASQIDFNHPVSGCRVKFECRCDF